MFGRKAEMLRRKDDETLKREVSLWLGKKEIPYQSYRNLSTHNKAVLHNLICIPPRLTTYSQRKDLYKKLCLPDTVAGKNSIDPNDSMPDEELKKFFTPLAPSETLSHLEKF